MTVNFLNLYILRCDTEADIGWDPIQVFQQESSTLSQVLRLVPRLFALTSDSSHRASFPDEILGMVHLMVTQQEQCTAESQTVRKSFLCDNHSLQIRDANCRGSREQDGKSI